MKILNLIIAKDENKKDILINVYVDKTRNIIGINFAGITYTNEELEEYKLNKITKELYAYISKTDKAIDISKEKKYQNKDIEDIIKIHEEIALTNLERRVS